MDFKGQTPGGINSNGTNSVPASDFLVPQNGDRAEDKSAQNDTSLQRVGAAYERPSATQFGAQTTSNSDNGIHSVVNKTSINTIAEDSDLIEKEWVLKAKNIVENTQNNPFLQSQRLAELRADYLQKRYGKSLEENT